MTTNEFDPGTNWNGHLPSDKIEREIFFAMEGVEDEDGNPISQQFHHTPDGPEHLVRKPQQHNTGPKGCRADARQDAHRKHMQRGADATRRQELQRGLALRMRPAAPAEEEEEEEEEDEAFQAYRMARLKEMQRSMARRAALPTFGHLLIVPSLEAYLSAIDAEGPDTFVVIHLSEDWVAPCVRLNFRLEELAQRYDQVKFAVVAASLVEDIAPSATADLPTLVAYRGGAYVGSEVGIAESLGEEMEMGAVEGMLTRMGVALTAAVAMREADSALLRRQREIFDASDEDSDESDAGLVGLEGRVARGARVDDDDSDDDFD